MPASGSGGVPRRGWGRKQTDRYEQCEVVNASGEKLGFLLINTHAAAESIDAHCTRCGVRLNRKYREHKRRPGHHQGRPAGALLAWLFLKCEGQDTVHKDKFNPTELTLATRVRARTIGQSDPRLAPIFEKERAPRDAEIEQGGEPAELV
jgi:hypothetical protein